MIKYSKGYKEQLMRHTMPGVKGELLYIKNTHGVIRSSVTPPCVTDENTEEQRQWSMLAITLELSNGSLGL